MHIAKSRADGVITRDVADMALCALEIDYLGLDPIDRRMLGAIIENYGGGPVGLETLAARYKVQADNALALARKLREVPEIKRVNYIALEDNPYYKLAQRQFGKTGGAMLTIDLADKAACFRFIDRLKLIRRATNLFDNKTLAIHPYSTIFGPFSGSQKRAMDVLDTTIRLSIGLEDVEDLFEDIVQATKN